VAEIATAELVEAGIGYTLATGRLFTRFADFHAAAERLIDRPILTHEFASTELWDELRGAFESQVRDRLCPSV
jgi:hypothetical protein